MSRILIHVGHYGSGKSELSIKYAMVWAKQGKKVTLVDLDIVNPYFRSGEHKERLEVMGVRVIRPNFSRLGLDVPSLPPEVASVFVDRDSHVIIDVGGDPTGAAALGGFHHRIKETGAKVRCVVNLLRPLTKDSDGIVAMVRDIERRSRVKITELVNNTNAARETDAEMLVNAQPIVEAAAKELNLPVAAIFALPEVIDYLPKEFKAEYEDIIHPMELWMRPEWLDS